MTKKLQATPAQHNGRDSTNLVLQAVQDLHAVQQAVTRHTVSRATGLKLTIIDDRLDALVKREQIYRVDRGIYFPIATHPPARLMSKTVLPDGWVKIEIGDELITLTPREDRILSQLQAGAAAQFASIEAGQQAALVHAQLARRVLALERENMALRIMREGSPQMDMLQKMEMLQKQLTLQNTD